MKRLISLFLVLTIVACNGCKSKKAQETVVEEKQVQTKAEAQVEPQVETQVAQESAETAVTEEKNAQVGLGVNCPSCNGPLKRTEDKKAMVCTKCGKEIDIQTYKGMVMQKLFEKMKKSQESQEKQQ
jgi:uncharacterized protein YbaR (Trm112 family)